uniref:Taste receptor type 2 n=1 Tax=Catagonus wagneri TaxID=51154 RepID=A0A8C3VZ23_9CETA
MEATICIVIVILLCLVAVVGNGLITATLGMEWLLRRTLSPADKLLISLGASRFCLQWVAMGRTLYIFLYPVAFPYNPVFQFLAFQWDFLNAATLWFSTWLSVFYCVKIATFTHPAFLWLKRNVSGLVPWMLLSSVGFSSCSTVLFFVGNQRIYENYLKRGLQSWNVTGNTPRRTYERFYFFPLKIVTCTVPTKVFPSISSLRDPSAQAHIKALLALISFAVLFLSYFLSLVLHAVGVFPSQEFKYWIWQALTYLCTAIHPIVLLWSYRRLRAVLERGCSSGYGAS